MGRLLAEHGVRFGQTGLGFLQLGGQLGQAHGILLARRGQLGGIGGLPLAAGIGDLRNLLLDGLLLVRQGAHLGLASRHPVVHFLKLAGVDSLAFGKSLLHLGELVCVGSFQLLLTGLISTVFVAATV